MKGIFTQALVSTRGSHPCRQFEVFLYFSERTAANQTTNTATLNVQEQEDKCNGKQRAGTSALQSSNWLQLVTPLQRHQGTRITLKRTSEIQVGNGDRLYSSRATGSNQLRHRNDVGRQGVRSTESTQREFDGSDISFRQLTSSHIPKTTTAKSGTTGRM